MKKSVCKLCNRRYNYKYSMFGRGCLNTEYELLNVQKPEKVDDRELYLCNKVANRLLKVGLSRKKKYLLTERYLTLQYLDRIKYGNLEKEKALLNQEIQNISFISTVASPLTPVSLNNAYRLYNTTQKFDKKLQKIEKSLNKNDSEDKKAQIMEELILIGMSFIFNLAKKKTPIEYKIYYYMQYAFWKTVIGGGLLADLKLSAILMEHSLSDIDQKVEDLTVDNKEIITKIKDNNVFKEKIRFLLNKYRKNRKSFSINENVLSKEEREDSIISFSNPDLFMSLHDATININGILNTDGKYDLKILIKDKYDFTDLKNWDDIYDGDNSIVKMFGNLLNNFGVVSMKYGVLKSYNVYVNIELKNYET